MGSDLWVGTARLVRLAVRQVRWTVAAWMAAYLLFGVGSLASLFSVYDEADAVSATEAIAENPITRMLYGTPPSTTVGGFVAAELLLVFMLMTAFLAALLTIRLTRGDEELGRTELLGGRPVGMLAPMAAATIVAVAATIIVTAIMVAVLLAYGLAASGSVVMGASAAAMGVLFAAGALLAAQLFASARSVRGVTTASIGIAFAIRAASEGFADTAGIGATPPWGVWLSPFGWSQQMRPFGDERWWPLFLSLGLAGCLAVLAGLLRQRRDLGVGFIAESPGRSTANAILAHPAGLVLRQSGGLLVGWTAGVAVASVVVGVVAADVDALMGQIDGFTEALIGLGDGTQPDPALALFGIVVWAIAFLPAFYVVQVGLRLHGEEQSGRLDAVLAAGVNRLRVLGSHAVIMLGGAIVLTLVAWLGMGLAFAVFQAGGSTYLAPLAGAMFAYVPAQLALGAAVLVVIGLLPRLAAGLSWAMLLLSVALSGILLVDAFSDTPLSFPGGVPTGIIYASPFSHIPLVPTVPVSAGPLLGLTATTVVLAAVSVIAYNRRDIA